MTESILPPAYERALRTILSQLRNSRVTWVLTGSMGMFLQGVQLPVHDIDLQTTSRGAYALERHLQTWMTDSVHNRETKMIRSHWGKGMIAGVEFEIMGDVRIWLPEGGWREKVDLKELRQWITWQGWPVPVLSLAYEAEAYAAMGRSERAALLRKYLSRPGL